MPLMIDAGHATLAGLRERNEDFVGMVTPHEPEMSVKGLLAAIADGVSGNDGGREASEYAVRGLLADYYATPDTWPVTQALDRVIKATNSWVQHQGSIRSELAGMATTLSAVVLRGGFYYFAHVGDTRIYLLRDGILTKLTSDHVWDRPEMHHVLTRAIGLDSRLAIDHGMGQLRAYDVFLLATDGMWASLAEYDIATMLSGLAGGEANAVDTATALVNAALAAGSTDNISAVILKIDALPEENLRDALSGSQQLPLPPKLKVGQTIDGYRVGALIHASRTTMLYRVIDMKSQRPLVLKTLHPDHADDVQERTAFAHEEWLAKKVVARFFPQVIMPPQQRNFLYYLTTWHHGHTLQQRMDAGEHFTIPDAIACGTKLVRALGALHRRSIIHCDIKPANVHLGDDGELRVLDLGVAQSGLDHEVNSTPQAGTPSFLAPEQFNHAQPSPQSDIYATGVTLYVMLTRRYPYGEIEPFQKPRFGVPTPPSQYRPDIPHWLENVLLKAVARDRADRFETAEEFLLALEHAATSPLAPSRTLSLAKRDPVALWRSAAIIFFIANLLLLYLLVMH